MKFQSPKVGKAAFSFIFLTVALDMIALGITAPVLPKLIVAFENGDLGHASEVAGWLRIAWAGLQLLCQPIVGSLSDRFGRRPAILLSNVGLGLSYIVMALAPSLIWLFVGRLLSGAASASFSTANAYISDITPHEKRAARFGVLAGAFGLGFVIGPAIGGLLGSVDLRLPFWAAAALSLINALYGYLVLPESLAVQDRSRRIVWRNANLGGSIRFLFRDRTLGLMASSIFFTYLAYEALMNIFVLYTDYRYNWDARTTGLALSFLGIMQTVISGVFVRHAVKRVGERTTALAGLGFGALGFLIFAWAPSGTAFVAALPFVALWSLAPPAFLALSARHADASESGTLQGALSSLRGITGIAGPLVFTQILSYEVATSGPPGAAYAVASLLLAVSFAIMIVAGKSSASKPGLRPSES